MQGRYFVYEGRDCCPGFAILEQWRRCLNVANTLKQQQRPKILSVPQSSEIGLTLMVVCVMPSINLQTLTAAEPKIS